MMEEAGANLSKSMAVFACNAMALMYVGILYAPTRILRLPPPSSFKHFMIRRFICASISTIASVVVSALILHIRSPKSLELLGIYGIRVDHIWQAVVLPLFLTSLMYFGSLVRIFLSFVEACSCRGSSLDYLGKALQELPAYIFSSASNILIWRNLLVAPLTEELVFRACMIPLLLCGGFGAHTVVFLCPVLFSLAHLNHFQELYYQGNRTFIQASMVVGLQLGYTVIFGSYASFLFVRTGNFLAPLVAHIFCNYMGLPVMFSRRQGMVTFAFLAGMIGFVCLLFPITRPDLYNDSTNNCKCWCGHCSWN